MALAKCCAAAGLLILAMPAHAPVPTWTLEATGFESVYDCVHEDYYRQYARYLKAGKCWRAMELVTGYRWREK